MYYVQQHPELKVPAMVLSALVRLHRKTGEEIDQVSFDEISHSDPLIESIDWQQAFNLGQDLEPALEQDILLNHRRDFGAKDTHWWLHFALSGGKWPLLFHRQHKLRQSGKSSC
jgi:hypothetical protein